MHCAICQEKCNSEYKLECGHEFHTECLMSWFRSGQSTCPCCRDEGCKIHSNFNYTRRLSKMSSCPQFIKDAISDFDHIKDEIKNIKDEISSLDCDAQNIKSQILQKKKKLKSNQKQFKIAKKAISNCIVFIVPIKKRIFI